MLIYLGGEYDYKAITYKVGDFSQPAETKRYVFTCGRAKGLEAVDISTDMSCIVLLDRALDIAWAEYKGIPLG